MKRIIIFTGKGGVGKSSTASANGVKSAQLGYKTLLVSTDKAHNLSDIFNKSFGKEEVELDKNLWGLEIDANYEMEKNFGNIHNALMNMFKFDNPLDKETFEDIMTFPGMEEIFSLLKIMQIYEKNVYDVIIIDCAPTGETLSLLQFPEILGWYMEKIFPIERVAAKIFRPFTKTLFKVSLPSNEAINDMEKLYIKLSNLQELLRNREITSIRIVTIPEKMVVEETKRNYMYLNLYDFNVDSIYINRIIPEEVDNKFFDNWKTIQKKYLEEIESVFYGIPMYKIKWYKIDIVGIGGLKKIVEDSLKDDEILNVKKVLYKESFEKIDNGYKLKIHIPLGDKKDFNLHESNSDIILKIGNFKRNIPKPNSLKKYEIVKAQLIDNFLNISFRKKV